MFFIFESSDSPLFELDVLAWRTLAQIVGDLPLPSVEEMQRYNMEVLLHLLNDPQMRFDCNDAVSSSWCNSVKYLISVRKISDNRSCSYLHYRPTKNLFPVKWI